MKQKPRQETRLVVSHALEQKIYHIRDQKVMLSPDLAKLYGVEVRALVQAVKRNIERFPRDFMFQLSPAEFGALKSQIVTSSWGGARRTRPYAFTEQGLAMLSSVLRSKRAIQTNIAVMRLFVKMRQFASTHADLAERLTQLAQKYDDRFRVVFEAIRELMQPEPQPHKRRIGFEVAENS